MEITLQLFGEFRHFGSYLKILLTKGATISDIRKELLKELQKRDPNFKKDLIDSSRFATETELLSDTHSLQDGSMITIIPPVAGG